MALANRIDRDQAKVNLQRWLASALPKAEQLRISKLEIPQASGVSATTIIFDALWQQEGIEQTRSFVARVQPRMGGVFEPCDLKREFDLLQGLVKNTDVPVPAPFRLENSDESVLGAPFLVMDYVAGRVARDDPPYTSKGWVMDLQASQRAELYDGGIRTLALLHNVDYRGIGMQWLGDTPLGAPRIADKIKGWRAYYQWACNGQEHPTIEAGFDWLESHKPSEEGDSVISWGDSRLGNMIIADDLSVAAVIDWEMVGLGCREVDLAWWLFVTRFHTEGMGISMPKGFPSKQQTIERYHELTGYRPQNIDYYERFAAVRLSLAFIRLGHMMIEAGLLPVGAPMPVSNPASQLLARLIGVKPPDGEMQDFVGNR